MSKMPLFGPFDALIESFGHKVGLSRRPGTPSKQATKQEVDGPKSIPVASTTSVSNGSKKVNEGYSLSSSTTSLPYGKTAGSQMRRKLRFALELDGVFCFDTIVPY